MRLAVIGNSHVGALKKGWDRSVAAEFPGISICWFASPKTRMTEIHPEAGALVPRTPELERDIAFTSDGLTRIEADSFDAFLVVGLNRRLERQIGNFCTPFSQAARLAALEDYWEGSNHLKLVEKLRRITNKPIHSAHAPLKSGTDGTGGTAEYETYLTAANARVFAPIEVALVPQPADTRVGATRTAPKFAKGSERLETGRALDGLAHSEDEPFHMNGTYGAIWMRGFLQTAA